MLDHVLTVVITALVYSGVAALLVGIMAINFYAILHAWRRGRTGWTAVLTVSFISGGGIAAALYLFLYYDEWAEANWWARRDGEVRPAT